MGDVGEMYKAIREHSQERRRERHQSADASGWSKHTKYHWYRMIEGEKLDYWPSTGRCRFKGRNRNINSKFIKELIQDDDN